jgi:hypothetical protein
MSAEARERIQQAQLKRVGHSEESCEAESECDRSVASQGEEKGR